MSLLLYPPRVHQFIFIFFLFFPFYFSLFVWQKSHRPSRFSPITVSFQTLLLSQNRLHSSLHPQLLSLSNCYFSPFASLLHLHPFTSFHRLLSPLQDLRAALFFFLTGKQIELAALLLEIFQDKALLCTYQKVCCMHFTCSMKCLK